MLAELFTYCPNFIFLTENYFASYVRVIDIVIAAFLLWGGYKGFQKGFFLEVLSTIVFVSGLLLVFYLINTVFQAAKGYLVESLKPTSFIFYILGFVLVSILINKIGQKMRSKISYSIFGDLDAFLGMALGVLKYAIFLSIIFTIFREVGIVLPEEAVADSYFYPKLIVFEKWLVEVGAKIAPVIGRIFAGITDLLQDRVSPE